MSVTANRTDAIERIRVLQQEAEALESKYQTEMNGIMEKIQQEAAGFSTDSGSFSNPATPVAGAKRRGRKPGSGNKPKTLTASKKKASSSDKRNYSNKISLKQTIWNVLKDLPPKSKGLQISEIRDSIESKGEWVSSSEDITTQLSGHLSRLKKDGLIARSEEGRYYPVKGATLVIGKRGRKKST